MKFLLVAFSALALAMAADIKEEGGVLVLTNDNFDGAIKDNEFVLVEFYAPWCGHCKALAPEYEKAAGKLKESGSAIKLAKVDATVEKELGDKFKVQGFPTLKFFKNGEPVEYSGPREADGIVNWLEKKTGPPAVALKTAKDAEKLTEDKNVVVIGFFKAADSKEAKAFESVADSIDQAGMAFAITTEKAVKDKYEVKKDNVIVMITKFDEGRTDYDGKIKKEDIEEWVQVNSLPLLNDFSQETASQIFGSTIKVHYILLADKSADGYDKIKAAVTPVAKANKGKIIFVVVDSSVEENSNILEFFGVKKEALPKYIIYEMEKNAKYLSDKTDVVEKEVSAFVKDYFGGKLTRTLKSEDLPEDWDANPVKVLVSSNFKEVAMDKTKNVFVEFYAPWCGHCKALAPKWDELGEKFKDSDDIVIAKMDSTANEIEEVEVQGFPTLKLFKKDTNEIIDYSGKREVADMVKFLETGEQGKSDGASDDDEEEEEEEEEEEGEKEHDEL